LSLAETKAPPSQWRRLNASQAEKVDNCYAITIRNMANLTNQEQWMELCELVSNEQDQDKLGALFERILHLLEDERARLNTAVDAMPQDTPALT